MAGGLEFMKNMKPRMFIPFLSLCFLILEPITLLGNFPADFVPDCNVNFNDFAVLASAWLTENGEPNYNSKCDISEPNDGVINEKDLAMFADFWLTKYPCDMVYISGGTFQMGDSKDDGYELPVHTVRLDSFYMGKYEITNQQYCLFLNSAYQQGLITVTSGVVYQAGSGTSYPYCDTSTSSSDSQIAIGRKFTVLTKGGRNMANDPMVVVSWYGAAAYCNWRSQQEGKELCYNLSTWNCDFSKKGYRLPTEAEWEYAARGGLTGRRFPWGDTISHSQANYYSSTSPSYDVGPTRGFHPLWNDWIWPYTSPVGFFDGSLRNKSDFNWPGSQSSYQATSGANGYGLYDMAGNVWEWCNDWYSGSYYSSSPVKNPTGPTSGSDRVLRGGGWFTYADYCRVADRGYYIPSGRFSYFGFRLSLDF